MRRKIAPKFALYAVLALLTALTWLRTEPPERERRFAIAFERQDLPPEAQLSPWLAPFRLEGAWIVRSRSVGFGGYSSLLALNDKGRFLAIGDLDGVMGFSAPDSPKRPLVSGKLLTGRFAKALSLDVEAATRDPATGTIWVATEGRNGIARLTPGLRGEDMVRPEAIAGWGVNQGTEAMARLQDGRFVLLREAFTGLLGRTTHDAVLFPGDPVRLPKAGRHFTMVGPRDYKPTDMAQLPDGRVLVLFRRLVWPMPQRFAGRIAIGDPARIAPGKPWRLVTVARLSSGMPVDNFEGMAIVPQSSGRVAVWLISDDNMSNFQHTLLWKLTVDPRELPR